MNTKFLLGALLAFCGVASAEDPYYVGNSYTPYPPGCITLLDRQSDLYGDNAVLFWTGSLWLEAVHKLQSNDPFENRRLVNMSLYRIGCAEPGRSVIMVEFTLPDQSADPAISQIVLPFFSGVTGFDPVPFELKPEPNSWGLLGQQVAFTKETFGDYSGGWLDAGNFVWRYVLEYGAGAGGIDYYNSQFGMEVWEDGALAGSILVPATEELLQPNPILPLNGRLSGTWVEQGTSDQGFLLTFSNPVLAAGTVASTPEHSELSVFLSWFTFDRQGQDLWLTGYTSFAQGSAEVVLPLELVSQGQFMGDRQAQRAVVGDARLKASSCNELELQYDLDAVGLGTGTIRLQRPDALEIAGYPCRDYEARLSALSDSPGL